MDVSDRYLAHLKTNKVHVWTGLDIALKMAECPNKIVYYESVP